MAITATKSPNSLIVQPPTGRAELPLFEFLPSEFNKPKGSPAVPKSCGANPTFTSNILGGTDRQNLVFDAWPFFHAAAKTELARSFSVKSSKYHGMMMSGSHGDMLRWNRPILRVRNGGIFTRKDSSRTYISSRFGEACMYLFMLDEGYEFWDHLPSLVDRAAGIGISHSESVRRARVIKSRLNAARQQRQQQSMKGIMSQPDFVFEKPNFERALAESKGRMVTPGKRPRFKKDLSDALDQISVWQSLITGKPKGYAIGTFLREIGDTYDESLMAFVDPPADDDGKAFIEVPDDFVRRGNYGAWLYGMGLQQTAYALAAAEPRRPEPIELPVVTIGHLDFAIVVADSSCYGSLSDLFAMLVDPIMFDYALNCAVVIGIEVSRLQAIEKVIRDVEDGSLLELRDLSVREINFDQLDGVYGSIYPDGSFYGLFRRGNLLMSARQKFKL